MQKPRKVIRKYIFGGYGDAPASEPEPIVYMYPLVGGPSEVPYINASYVYMTPAPGSTPQRIIYDRVAAVGYTSAVISASDVRGSGMIPLTGNAVSFELKIHATDGLQSFIGIVWGAGDVFSGAGSTVDGDVITIVIKANRVLEWKLNGVTQGPTGITLPPGGSFAPFIGTKDWDGYPGQSDLELVTAAADMQYGEGYDISGTPI